MATMVTFGQVEGIEYPTIVGINPGGTGGPPLTIGWDALGSTLVDVDLYEDQRKGYRRGHDELIISLNERVDILRKKLGFSWSEINIGTKRANIARNKRKRTNQICEHDGLYEKIEHCGRNLRHVSNLGLRKRAERKYIQSALMLDSVRSVSDDSWKGTLRRRSSFSTISCSTESTMVSNL